MNDTDTTLPVISTAGAEILYSSNDKMMPRARHFDRSGGEWRNLTPHGTGGMAAGVLSAQSLESPDLSPMPAGSSARDDQWACILPSENRYGKKGCEEMICMSSRSFFVGEIPWGCEVMAHPGSFLPILSHSCLWGINFCKNKVLDRKKAFSYNKEEREKYYSCIKRL